MIFKCILNFEEKIEIYRYLNWFSDLRKLRIDANENIKCVILQKFCMKYIMLCININIVNIKKFVKNSLFFLK